MEIQGPETGAEMCMLLIRDEQYDSAASPKMGGFEALTFRAGS
jgi:hypothetical protein